MSKTKDYELTITPSDVKPGAVECIFSGPGGPLVITSDATATYQTCQGMLDALQAAYDTGVSRGLLEAVNTAINTADTLYRNGYEAGATDTLTLLDGQSLRTVGEVADVRVNGEVG